MNVKKMRLHTRSYDIVNHAAICKTKELQRQVQLEYNKFIGFRELEQTYSKRIVADISVQAGSHVNVANLRQEQPYVRA